MGSESRTQLFPETLLKRVSADDLPVSSDLFQPEELTAFVAAGGFSYPLIVVGDIMLGERSVEPIEMYGADYPFQAVLPLLKTSSVVFGNLEGPFAPETARIARRHSYAVNPSRASTLASAGINLVTLANNHVTDCGRQGLVETIETLRRAGVEAVGGGIDDRTAHAPVVREIGGLRIGFLGYYWHRRCAAGPGLPGVALDTPGRLEADIGALRRSVDRIVVAFHWGIPYGREPLQEDRAKARFAIDCGADLVVGHHPHVIQPFEIHRGRLIFYSVGNFAFGSGNSRAEGALLGVRFEEGGRTQVDVFPLYVKNRDPRVNYQTKVMKGAASVRMLSLLARLSGAYGRALSIEGARGRVAS